MRSQTGETERRPGHRYIVKHDVPQHPEDLEAYVVGYADFLRKVADIDGIVPVPLDPIFERFQITRQQLQMGEAQQGLKFSLGSLGYQVVLVEESDKPERQRFSLGHELVELLFEALHQGMLSDRMLEACSGARKERLCERGAAALLMPADLYKSRLRNRPTSIDTASALAGTFNVSLLGALIRMVELVADNHLLIAWRWKRKPKEKRRQSPGQLSFAGMESEGPSPKLRVEWCRWTRQVPGWFVPANKSISEASLIYRSFHEQRRLVGTDEISLGSSFRGVFDMEVFPAQVGDARWVFSLLDVSTIHP